MNHISFDIETLGKTAGCIVLSIGACKFDPVTGETGERFYANLDRWWQEDRGGTVDQSTIDWWATQSSTAQERLLVDVRRPTYALQELTAWTGADPIVWGYGSNFDIVILEALYRLCGGNAPWKYSNVRCGRTLCVLADVPPVRNADSHHTADMDALRQAEAYMGAWTKLGVMTQAVS